MDCRAPSVPRTPLARTGGSRAAICHPIGVVPIVVALSHEPNDGHPAIIETTTRHAPPVSLDARSLAVAVTELDARELEVVAERFDVANRAVQLVSFEPEPREDVTQLCKLAVGGF